jgi:hypothetical protein
MPDLTKKTISASQMAALFELSPYATRYQLYHWVVSDIEIEQESNARLEWGLRHQQTILDWVSDELRIDVAGNDEYYQNTVERIGCTGDGYAVDPQRGLGVVEAKCSDWMQWKDTWTSEKAPAHIELQVQTQMMVPHPELGAPVWGAIACLVGGNDMRLYMREPDPAVQDRIREKVSEFWSDVADRNEPPLGGLAVEQKILNLIYPEVDDNEPPVDLRGTPEDDEIGDMLRMYAYARTQRGVHEKAAKKYQSQILERAANSSTILTSAATAYIKKARIAETTISRQASVRNSITVKENPAADPLKPFKEAAIDG